MAKWECLAKMSFHGLSLAFSRLLICVCVCVLGATAKKCGPLLFWIEGCSGSTALRHVTMEIAEAACQVEATDLREYCNLYGVDDPTRLQKACRESDSQVIMKVSPTTLRCIPGEDSDLLDEFLRLGGRAIHLYRQPFEKLVCDIKDCFNEKKK